MYFLSSCYFDSDFVSITKTSHLIDPIAELARLKDDILKEKTSEYIGIHQSELDTVVSSIRPYQFGLSGSYAKMDE